MSWAKSNPAVVRSALWGRNAFSTPVFNNAPSLAPFGVRHYPGQGLRAMRIRIASVKNIQKITASMKMIATAKLTKARAALDLTRPFSRSSQHFMDLHYPPLPLDKTGQEMELTNEERGLTPLEGTHLLVLVTSDRGLCGVVNTAVVRAAIKLYRADPDKTTFFIIGEKGKAKLLREYASSFDTVISEVGGNKRTTWTEVAQISDLICNKPFERITVIHNYFNSAISYTQKKKTYPHPKAFAERKYNKYEFEEDQTGVLRDYFAFFLSNLLYSALIEGSASELSARMTAMENATKNAKEILSRLTVTYNRQRQAAITTELSEIVSGAAAISQEQD